MCQACLQLMPCVVQLGFCRSSLEVAVRTVSNPSWCWYLHCVHDCGPCITVVPALQVLAAREPDSIQQDASRSTPALVLAAHEDNLTHDEVSCAEARCQLLRLRRALAQYLLAEVMAGEGKLMYPVRWGDAGQQALPTLLGRHPECPAPMLRHRSHLGRGRSYELRV